MGPDQYRRRPRFASWSLLPPCGTCYFAPNICSSLPSYAVVGWSRRDPLDRD
jgi:hypothetical protein